MTVLMGMTLRDGVFLAADSRRTNLDTGKPHENAYRKFERLGASVVIATGGLAGDGVLLCRQILQDLIAKHRPPLAELVNATQLAFSECYKSFLASKPPAVVPLRVVVAGANPDTGYGFIYTLYSDKDFAPEIRSGHGTPFILSSNTPRATEVLLEHHRRNNLDTAFQLDKWAHDTIAQLASEDTAVGLPVQIIRIGKTFTERFPVGLPVFNPDVEFQTEKLPKVVERPVKAGGAGDVK